MNQEYRQKIEKIFEESNDLNEITEKIIHGLSYQFKAESKNEKPATNNVQADEILTCAVALSDYLHNPGADSACPKNKYTAIKNLIEAIEACKA